MAFLAIRGNLTDTEQLLYEAPINGAIIIGVQVSHTGTQDGTDNIEIMIEDSDAENRYNFIGKSTEIYPKSAFTIYQGKGVLNPGEKIYATSSIGATDINISIMEF